MPESLLIRSVTFVFSVFSAVTLYNRTQLVFASCLSTDAGNSQPGAAA